MTKRVVKSGARLAGSLVRKGVDAARKSEPYKKAKRFAVTTVLGAIGVPLIS